MKSKVCVSNLSISVVCNGQIRLYFITNIFEMDKYLTHERKEKITYTRIIVIRTELLKIVTIFHKYRSVFDLSFIGQ